MGNPFERMPPKDIERAECPNCKGSGYVEDTKGNSKKCSRCNGTGIKPVGR